MSTIVVFVAIIIVDGSVRIANRFTKQSFNKTNFNSALLIVLLKSLHIILAIKLNSQIVHCLGPTCSLLISIHSHTLHCMSERRSQAECEARTHGRRVVHMCTYSLFSYALWLPNTQHIWSSRLRCTTNGSYRTCAACV